MKQFKINWNKLLVVSVLIPLPIVLTSILNGSMPFWFDPARDFLAALANQHKITLIGQPTGIPGLFYGPYWIWLLSLGLFVSKDPRTVQFLVLGIPYLILFPIVLNRFKSILGVGVTFSIWLLFIFTFMRYAIFPWNPHLAPFFVLVVIYLLIKEWRKNRLIYIFAAGIVTGLIGNFHISFDIGLLIGIFVYLLLELFGEISIKSIKKAIVQYFLFAGGFLLAFVPFLVFELRHGFMQTRVVLGTLLSPYPQVGLKGLTKSEIIKDFTSIPGQILHIQQISGEVIILISIIIFFALWIKRKISLNKEEKNLFILCVAILASVLFVFIKSKNPVWDYHFIAVEIPFLLLIGLFFKKIPFGKILLLIWGLVILFQSYFNYFSVPHPSILSYDTLAKKEYIVRLINNDSRQENFTVFVYNPGIYTYEYTYLFNWIAHKDVPYDPSQIKRGGKLVYLVIQKTDQGIFQDFINSHAPDSSYKTVNSWNIPDGTLVLKRQLGERK